MLVYICQIGKRSLKSDNHVVNSILRLEEIQSAIEKANTVRQSEETEFSNTNGIDNPCWTLPNILWQMANSVCQVSRQFQMVKFMKFLSDF